jgi:Domain of unknown function (DUF4836)
MKCKPNQLLVLVIAVISLAACGKKKEGIETMIPKDAAVVVAVNTQQLMDKLAQGGLSVDGMESLMSTLQDSVIKPASSFWADAATTGIDFKQPAYFSMTPSNDITDNRSVIRVIVALADADKFTAFVKKQGLKVDETGSIKFITGPNDDMIIGFNKNYIVTVKDIAGDQFMRVKNSSATPTGNITEFKEWNEAQVKEAITATFKMSASKSILENANYAKQPIANNDIRFWANQDFLAKSQSNDSKTNQMMEIVAPLLKDLTSSTVLNFDNGKVVAKSESYFNKEVAEMLKKTASKNIDFSLLSNFPGKTLNGVAGFSIDPTTIENIAKFTKGGDGFLSLAEVGLGFKRDELFSAINGDVIVAISDLGPENLKDKGAQNSNLGIIIKIKNKANVDKLLALPKVAPMLKKEGELFIFGGGDGKEPAYMAMNDKTIIISPNKAFALAYITSTTPSGLDKVAMEKLKSNPGGYYFSVESIANLVTTAGTTNVEGIGSIARNALGLFKETYCIINPLDGNTLKATAELVLTDAKINSLATMIRKGFGVYMSSLAFKGSINEEDTPSATPIDDRIKPMEPK